MINDVTVERTFVTFKGNESHVGQKMAYTFILLDGKVYLECIKLFERESNRHKWKMTRLMYSRLSPPRHIPCDQRTEAEAIVMAGTDICAEAVERVRNSIQLTTWKKP